MFMVLKETYSQWNPYPNANDIIWQIFLNVLIFFIKPQKIHDGWNKFEKEAKIGSVKFLTLKWLAKLEWLKEYGIGIKEDG